MKYICERCIHKYPNGGCIVPCTIGYTGKCYYFYEKPKHATEQTNEEWFCGLSTEEKAKWIAEQKCDGCHDEPYDERYGVCKYCMAKKTEQIREWLKQPHREENEK